MFGSMNPLTKLYILVVLASLTASFDPTKVNYCTLECPTIHTGCDCGVEMKRTEYFGDIVKFRTDILEEHHKYRNKIARGDEMANFKAPKAANMNTMKYDMEMEWLARCYAGRYYKGHDDCRDSHTMAVGQNIGTTSENSPKNLLDFVFGWYAEVNRTNGTQIEHFHVIGKDGKIIGHFSQMVWGCLELMGCARTWSPDVMGGELGKYILVCNYGSVEASQYPGAKIYEIGEPCSKCPKGRKCNDKYPALCGDIVPVPTDAPPPMRIRDKPTTAAPTPTAGGPNTSETTTEEKKKSASFRCCSEFYTIMFIVILVLN